MVDGFVTQKGVIFCCSKWASEDSRKLLKFSTTNQEKDQMSRRALLSMWKEMLAGSIMNWATREDNSLLSVSTKQLLSINKRINILQSIFSSNNILHHARKRNNKNENPVHKSSERTIEKRFQQKGSCKPKN